MKQILVSWNLLAPQKQLVLVLAILATVVTLFGLARLATKPQMALLYSGLSATASGEIVTSLEQKGVPYEVRGDSIYIDGSQRDRLRLVLAGEGLPANSVAGYELLDGLSGFGTTAQMFDATYWRAKEGELARTILASDRISMARVHIANPVSRPFEREVSPSASVTVSSRNGALDRTQAEAIRYLVAAAVSGLAPEMVTVIDSDYGVILQPGQPDTPQATTGGLDERAEALRKNVERLLSARVGQGNVIVEVMVESRNETETVRERILDPDQRVAVSAENETSTENSSGGNTGAVTVASNLPDTPASAGEGSRNSEKTRERTNYDGSETLRERTRLAGDIARLSVAVLVNEIATTGTDGAVSFTPRSAEELNAFRMLVQSAVGFNEARGDVVTIESMPFPQPPMLGTTATSGMFSGIVLNLAQLIQIALLGIVALLLGLFVIRPILKNPAPEFTQIGADERQMLQADQHIVGGAALEDAGSSEPAAPPPDPIEILRDTITGRAEESSHLLRNWIESENIPEKEPVS